MELMEACASSKKCVSLMPRRLRVAQCTISVRVRPGETVLTRSLVIGMRVGRTSTITSLYQQLIIHYLGPRSLARPRPAASRAAFAAARAVLPLPGRRDRAPEQKTMLPPSAS